MTQDTLSRSLPRYLTGYAAVAVVLAVQVLVLATAVREKSNTYDELAHITAGLSYWTRDDYRLQPEDGVLPSRWFALPLLAQHVKLPDDPKAWTASNVWAISNCLFFNSEYDADDMLWRARCMTVLVSAGLGLLIYVWSRRLFGPGGGMLSLLMYAVNPTVLANGNLTTTDLIVATFFTLSVGCLWKLFHRISLGSFVFCWLALAGLALSKMSGLLIVPMCGLLLLIRLIARRSLQIHWRRDTAVNHRAAQAGVLLGTLLLQMALVVATIWAFYGFRYSAFRGPLNGQERFFESWDAKLADAGAFGHAIEFARQRRLLPEAYLYGVSFVYGNSQARSAFLNGEWSLTGWRTFFPYTFLVKTPTPVFALLAMAAAGAVWSWRKRQPGRDRPLWRAFYETAPLWTLLAVYWTVAINSKLNIGHRHILPTYPAMFILAGAAAHWFGQQGRLRWIMPSAVVVCVGLLIAECAGIYPHYLAYFNWIAGGPSNGYKHLVDSSLDWGQDLPGLKKWLKSQDLESPDKRPVYLMYFGRSRPSYYEIHATPLAGSARAPMAALREGVYCISATDLQRVYAAAGGPWTDKYEGIYQETLSLVREFQASPDSRASLSKLKGEAYWKQVFETFDALRLSRLCAALRHRRPDANVGHSILIYRISKMALSEMLDGPPPELSAAGARKR